MTIRHRILLTLLILSANLSFSHVLDLTYSFDENTIYWPTEKGFSRHTVFYGKTKKGYFYSAFKFCAPEHGGTHVDAPRHFSAKGITVDEILPQNLIGQAVVIDVSKKVNHNANYLISVADVKAFEKQYRPLCSDDIVLFHTGWGRYWHDKKAYLGTAKFRDLQNLHFPGISPAAAQYLLQKKVKALGIDTASMDAGVMHEHPVHQLFLAANKYGIENVAHLNQLPALGATLIVAPMKIQGGSGAPARLLATW